MVDSELLNRYDWWNKFIMILTFLQVHTMKKIRTEYMSNPEFDPVKVRAASSAAEGLCKWVQAMEIYDRVAKVCSECIIRLESS